MSQLIEEITALYREYRATPILVAVWCVDRPDALKRIRALLEREAPVAPTSIVGQIPIYEWYRRMADADDLARRPACFEQPGVYMQFNNGVYVGVAL